MNIGVVIPAAGIGKRMNSATPKQFLLLNGEPILSHTIQIFEHHPLVSEIIIVTNEQSMAFVTELVTRGSFHKVKDIILGGKERQDSVHQGVLATRAEWVFVHDAVRPFVSEGSINDIATSLMAGKQAVTLAVPVKETVKQVDSSGKITQTLDRASLWSTQTPQAFSRQLLLKAHQYAVEQNLAATDDAMLVETMGEMVYVVKGEYTNIKITTPEDLIIGEAILERKKADCSL